MVLCWREAALPEGIQHRSGCASSALFCPMYIPVTWGGRKRRRISIPWHPGEAGTREWTRKMLVTMWWDVQGASLLETTLGRVDFHKGFISTCAPWVVWVQERPGLQKAGSGTRGADGRRSCYLLSQRGLWLAQDTWRSMHLHLYHAIEVVLCTSVYFLFCGSSCLPPLVPQPPWQTQSPGACSCRVGQGSPWWLVLIDLMKKEFGSKCIFYAVRFASCPME